MMLILTILVLGALAIALGSAVNPQKCPAWMAILLLCLVHLLQLLVH